MLKIIDEYFLASSKAFIFYCQVRNTIPSISAITGVTPQRYVWRVCIALHCAPRFAIGFLYWNYFMQRSCYVAGSQVAIYRWLVKLAFWVYTIENCCLVGVTYIANVENYRKELFKCINFFILLGRNNVSFF